MCWWRDGRAGTVCWNGVGILHNIAGMCLRAFLWSLPSSSSRRAGGPAEFVQGHPSQTLFVLSQSAADGRATPCSRDLTIGGR